MGILYDHDREEILEVVDSDTLIEVLEVLVDVPFERLLNGLAQLQANEKVITILEHFTHDDEVWVVNLSRELLKSHTNS